ncbi:MAG: hypothetical protein LBL83_06600, partial [Clostridiales bacterium]|nr:hypothetical protein [Clostridiales bacterium]
MSGAAGEHGRRRRGGRSSDGQSPDSRNSDSRNIDSQSAGGWRLDGSAAGQPETAADAAGQARATEAEKASGQPNPSSPSSPLSPPSPPGPSRQPKKRTSLVWRIASSQVLSNISVIASMNAFFAVLLGAYLLLQICAAAGAAERLELSGPSPLFGAFERAGGDNPYLGPGLALPRQAAAILNVPEGTVISFSAVRTRRPSLVREWFAFSSHFAFEAGTLDDGRGAAGATGATDDLAGTGVATAVAAPSGDTGEQGDSAGTGEQGGRGGPGESGESSESGESAGRAPAYSIVTFSHDRLFFDLWRALCALLAFELLIIIG